MSNAAERAVRARRFFLLFLLHLRNLSSFKKLQLHFLTRYVLALAVLGGHSRTVKFPYDLRSRVTWIQFVSSYPHPLYNCSTCKY